MNTVQCVPPNLQFLTGYIVVIRPKRKGSDKGQNILVDLISYHWFRAGIKTSIYSIYIHFPEWHKDKNQYFNKLFLLFWAHMVWRSRINPASLMLSALCCISCQDISWDVSHHPHFNVRHSHEATPSLKPPFVWLTWLTPYWHCLSFHVCQNNPPSE